MLHGITINLHLFFWSNRQPLTSSSRTLKYLAEDLNLVKYVRNPFMSKYTYVALTPLGKKHQQVFRSIKDLDTLPRKVVDRLVVSNGI